MEKKIEVGRDYPSLNMNTRSITKIEGDIVFYKLDGGNKEHSWSINKIIEYTDWSEVKEPEVLNLETVKELVKKGPIIIKSTGMWNADLEFLKIFQDLSITKRNGAPIHHEVESVLNDGYLLSIPKMLLRIYSNLRLSKKIL